MIYIYIFFPPVFSSFLVCIQHCKTVRRFSPFYLDLKCPYCADGFSLHPLSRFPSDLRLLTVFGDSQNEPASTRIFFFKSVITDFAPPVKLCSVCTLILIKKCFIHLKAPTRKVYNQLIIHCRSLKFHSIMHSCKTNSGTKCYIAEIMDLIPREWITQ